MQSELEVEAEAAYLGGKRQCCVEQWHRQAIVL